MKTRSDRAMNTTRRIYKSEDARGVGGFLQDLATGLQMAEVWRAFAWDEIQHRYRRSILGIVWILIAFAFFVGGVVFFFSDFSGMSGDRFALHVALGYLLFVFIVGNLVDGCQVFVSSKIWIKAVPLPYSVHVYRSLFRSFVNLALNSIVVALIMVWVRWTPGLVLIHAAPALVVYLINAVAIQYLLGMVAARYRDVGHLVESASRLLLFVTPILWVREGLEGVRAFAADLNPLTHYIDLIRSPIMGEAPRLASWGVVGGCTIVICLLTLVTGSMYRRRLPYWL